MRIWISLGLFLLAVSAHAEIYTCEENGRKMFSQQPCGKDAKTVTLQNNGRRVTIDAENNPKKAAEDLCSLARDAWDVALSSNRINNGRVGFNSKRIGLYVKERIANFEELRQQGQSPEVFVNVVVVTMQRLVSLDSNPSSEILNGFKDDCSKTMMAEFEKIENNGKRAQF